MARKHPVGAVKGVRSQSVSVQTVVQSAGYQKTGVSVNDHCRENKNSLRLHLKYKQNKKQ